MSLTKQVISIDLIREGITIIGWLIYAEKDAQVNESYIDWFIEEGKKQQVNIQLIHRERLQIGIGKENKIVLYDNESVKLPDFAVVRSIEPIIQHTFQSMMIPTFNPFNVAQMVNHKSWTYLEMHQLGIPILPTFFATKETLPTHPPLPYPFVLKEARGRGGAQVYYITSQETWLKAQHSLPSGDIVMQSADVQLGKDLRVFVIGKEIVAAVLRKSKQDFRANFTLGGTAERYTLSTEQTKMIEKIINHFDFGLVGIDFLISHDGELIFNEIEG